MPTVLRRITKTFDASKELFSCHSTTQNSSKLSNYSYEVVISIELLYQHHCYMSGLLSGMMRPGFCQELGGSSIPNILGRLVHIPKAPSIVGQRETFLMLDTTNIHT